MRVLVCLVALVFCLSAEEKLILVTGCARSGTTYMTEVLRASGLRAAHEAYAPDGVVSWTMAVNADTTPWGPPYKEGLYRHIFHQVRNPLKCIASVIATEPKESWDFIKRFLPQITPNDSKLVKAVKYWIYWNRLAEEKAEMTYRVEDLPLVLQEIGERIGYPLSAEVLKSIPKNVNHRKEYEYPYNWSELEEILPEELFFELREQAFRYGYK